MSRAFVREIDDAPEPPMPERPISDAPNLVTPRGAAQIDATLDAIAAQLAAGEGDTEALQRDQRYWSARSASMQIVSPQADPESVAFGTRVVIKRRGKTVTLTIVGEDEAEPAQGLIAWTSPLARALDGASAGEVIDLETGQREETITVVSVSAG